MSKKIASIRDVQPQRRNANRHSPRGMGALERSIQEDGWIGAITVAADGETFDGSARIETAGATGFDEIEPIIVRSRGDRPIIHVREDIPSATDERALRLSIAANRIAELNLSWSPAVLVELGETLDLSGLFNPDEMAAVLAEVQPEVTGGADDDAIPAINPEQPTRVQPGDIWRVGPHLIACLDSTEPGNLDRVLAVSGRTGKIGIVTDPPYGIDFDTDYRRFTTGFDVPRTNHRPVANDDKPFDPTPWLEYPSVVLWGANCYSNHLPLGSWLVWDKRFENGEAFLSDAEAAWMKGGYGVYIFSLTSQGFVRPEQIQHPTQKPVRLFEWCMEKAKTGNIVLDPFAGSGTTLIAAENTGRAAILFEVDPHYCDVAIGRWERLTGREGVRLVAEAENLTCERVSE